MNIETLALHGPTDTLVIGPRAGFGRDLRADACSAAEVGAWLTRTVAVRAGSAQALRRFWQRFSGRGDLTYLSDPQLIAQVAQAAERGLLALRIRTASRPGPLADLTEAEIDRILDRMVPAGDLVELGAHAAATDNRRALGVSGQEVQSAHGLPQAVGRRVPGYNADHALTRLMARAAHAGMDAHWKTTFQEMRRRGRIDATAQEIFDIVAESIRRAPIGEGERNALVARLSDEMFVEWRMRPGDLVELPYPNIKPV